MNRKIGKMEYVKDYEDIRFRVSFSVPTHKTDEVSFAAQPYELMESKDFTDDPSFYLIYGKMDLKVGLHIGFTSFSFKITQELHQRMGRLYVLVEKECLRVYDKGEKMKG